MTQGQKDIPPGFLWTLCFASYVRSKVHFELIFVYSEKYPNGQ